MKKNKASGSLFSLLTKNYLFFTLVLVLIAAGVYLLWTYHTAFLLSGADVDALISSQELMTGEYKDVDAARLLGNGGAFAVLDDKGEVLYRSSPDFDAELSEGELSCVPEYAGNYYVNYLEYTADEGATQYLVTLSSNASADELATVSVMVLDQNYNVLSGGFDEGRTRYTPSEFGYLTGSLSDQYGLYRYTFTDKNENNRTLLIRVTVFTEDNYDKIVSSSNKMLLLAVPLYIMAALAFILWMNRKIRRPLEKLDDAIARLGEGKPTLDTDCGGPEEIRRLGENFDKMAAKLAESERERKQLENIRQKLVTDISHDLKTPITVISGYTNAIRDGKVSGDELPRYLEAIDSKVVELTGLINSFYEYSRTEHPDFRLQCVDTDICEYLREYLAEKYDEIDLAGFNMDISIPDTKLLCSLDAFQFRRVLDNILSNALKHNTLGTLIRIKVTRFEDKAVITIADNGNGIPEAIKERLFEPFTVGDQSRSGGGSGLGLAIARRIVEAHGGAVRLIPTQGGSYGTEFEILLPLKQK